MQDLRATDIAYSRRLRLNTLIRLRWLAVAGQSVAVFVVAYWLDFPLPVWPCLALIACSAWLNLFLALRYPSTHRLNENAALVLLSFDALQLGGLLYLTGGMTNPFAVLLIVPVIISATALPLFHTLALGGVAVFAASVLVFVHEPLPWYQGTTLEIPVIYIAGMWLSVVSTLFFSAVYAWRVAQEARQLAGALTATEFVLQREQHLSALDGLAAAAAHELGTPLATIAVVTREMERSLQDDSPLREDVMLLRSQIGRCRDILQRLTSLSEEGDKHIGRMPLAALIEEVIAPQRDLGVNLLLRPARSDGPEPVWQRNPGVIYGLGNLVENAIDFGRETVRLEWGWDADKVWLRIIDDGPGISADILDRIGEPYAVARQGGGTRGARGGLGLGLFIAKTLLERSGAALDFSNSSEPGEGARISVTWPRGALAYSEPGTRNADTLDSAGERAITTPEGVPAPPPGIQST